MMLSPEMENQIVTMLVSHNAEKRALEVENNPEEDLKIPTGVNSYSHPDSPEVAVYVVFGQNIVEAFNRLQDSLDVEVMPGVRARISSDGSEGEECSTGSVGSD